MNSKDQNAKGQANYTWNSKRSEVRTVLSKTKKIFQNYLFLKVELRHGTN